MVDKNSARGRALALVANDGRNVATRLGRELGISRQAANKHLKILTDDGLIAAEGNTRARVHRLRVIDEAARTYPIAGLDEDTVWKEVFARVTAGLPANVRDIWHYGVTEMVNNAIEHSGSTKVEASVHRNALYTDGLVVDSGEGIFLKIQRAFSLLDPREAIFELAKGKLTTDPANHTGEGIFFSSRMFDTFAINSSDVAFVHSERPYDILLEQAEVSQGTQVLMRLANDSPRTTKSVFDQFASPEEYTFSKTIVPVRLAQYEGEKLVSRSQAKRLSQRLERFRHVALDFAQVVEIGQAFADELFRVFAKAHPQVSLTAINMTSEVERMVRRARAADDETA